MTQSKTAKVRKALEKVTDEISSLSKNMENDDGELDSGRVKQLRELCAAAKELSALLKEYGSTANQKQLTVRFTGDSEQWAQ